MGGIDSNLASTVLALPCIVALALKLVLAWNTRDSIRRSNVCIWLFIATLFGLNVGEFFLFLLAHNPEHPFALFALKYVYIFIILMTSWYLLVSLSIARRLTPTAVVGVAVPGFIAILFILIPNGVLSGVATIGYTLTRVAGPYYSVFTAVFLGGIVGGALILLLTYLLSADPIQRRQAKGMLIGTFPISMVCVVVMALMQLGVHINLSVIGTFAIIFLLYVLIVVEHRDRLYEFLSRVPTTEEYRLMVQINRALAQFDLQKIQDLAEEKLIPEALVLTNGNLSHASKMLGISRNTLTRRIRKFEDSPQVSLENHSALENR